MKAAAQRPVLIVASVSDGHRQNYVAVLGRWFTQMGHPVVIACGIGEGGLRASQTRILAQFLESSGAAALDIERDIILEPARFRAHLSKLEDELDPIWTLLVNGDECVRALEGEWTRQSEQRRRAAIFIYFRHLYPSDMRQYSFFCKCRPWARHVRERHRQRHFFKREVWSRLGLDLILATDEHAVKSLSHPQIRYLPEIYRAWGSDIGTQPPEIERAQLAYSEFLGRHAGKDVLLYYGSRFMRRGYHTLLALASEHRDTLFVSVGRDGQGESLSEDASRFRCQLIAQDRLFQLDIPFIPENRLVDDLFRSCRYVVLPYQHWYGSSGSLLQATSYGCPVLVPDIGYMGDAVCRYDIGLTYRHLNLRSLCRQLNRLRRDPVIFRDNALRFSRRVDQGAVFDALSENFGEY